LPASSERFNLRAVRVLRLLFSLSLVALFTGCGSVAYRLPGHSAQQHSAPVHLALGQRLLALETPARLPAPGGFALGLASEDPAIVGVETTDRARGASASTLVARGRGRTTVHYVNRFATAREATPRTPRELEELRAGSLGAFEVEVR
jgi:hypothetical protein